MVYFWFMFPYVKYDVKNDNFKLSYKIYYDKNNIMV